MIFLKILQKLVKLLHSEISPNQIAGGFALGSIIGLSPFFSIQGLAVFIIILMIKVNIGAAFFGMAVFGIIGYFIDPLADIIGYLLLAESPSLTVLWTTLYNMPIVPFTKFYNTVVLGNFIIGINIVGGVFWLSKKFILYYRANLKEKVERLKIVKVVKVSRLFSLYKRIKNL